MTDGLLLSGDLSEIRLPLLLMSLYRNKETGVLTVMGERYRKSLYILDGNVVFATSTNPDDRLGETLLRRGVITVQQYLESAEEIRPGRRQGEILIDMGSLTPEGLVEGVSQQVYDIIFSLFLQTSGGYTLSVEDFSTYDMITISMEMPQLVLKGMEKVQNWSVVFAAVGEPSMRVRIAPALPPFLPALDLNPDAEHILGLCKAGMTVEAVIDASYLNSFETYRLLWIFLTLNLIEKGEAAGKAGSPPLGADCEAVLEHFNSIFAYIHLLTSRGCEGVERRMEEVLRPLRTAYPNLMADQEGLFQYGRLDIDVALAALRYVAEGERQPLLRGFLNEILYGMVYLADHSLDSAGRQAVHAHLQREAALLSGT